MKKQKKLQLSKSTIRTLAEENLKEVVAGRTSGQSYDQVTCQTFTTY